MARQRSVCWSGLPKRALLGLLLVLAFIFHDVLMAVPAPLRAPEPPSLALTLDAHALDVSSPHLHGCQVGRPAVLNTGDGLPLHSTTPIILGDPDLSWPAELAACTATTQARAPTPQRAMLQIFRI